MLLKVTTIQFIIIFVIFLLHQLLKKSNPTWNYSYMLLPSCFQVATFFIPIYQNNERKSETKITRRNTIYHFQVVVFFNSNDKKWPLPLALNACCFQVCYLSIIQQLSDYDDIDGLSQTCTVLKTLCKVLSTIFRFVFKINS